MKKEMVEGYESFRIRFTSGNIGFPYPPNHDLLELVVTWYGENNHNPQHTTYEYLRRYPGHCWYRCENYKKVGKSLRK